MPAPAKKPRRPRWFRQEGLRLFVSLILFVGLYPLFERRFFGRVMGSVFLGQTLLVGLSDVRERRFFWVALVPGLLTLTLGILNSLVFASLALLAVATALWLVLIAFLLAIFLRYVMRSETVTAGTIFSAASVYILIGIVYALAYSLVLQVSPLALRFPEPRSGPSIPAFSDMLYFSFSTLTTLGYGDIVPTSPVAQSLALLEALTGVLFTAVLMARLIGLHMREGLDR
jgi:hypothetical protein